MQCPGCDYTVTGHETRYPCRTHCCQTCEWCPGRHGPRCARLLSAYAERPRACPGCHTYAVTGISSTHCCRVCAFNDGQHGDFCHRREVHWSLREEYSKTLEHRLLLSRVRAMEGVQPVNEVAPPNIDRCAYVMLLYGSDVEYALGALLVASSLRRAGARAQLVLLHTKDVLETRLELVRLFYDEVRLLSDPIHLPDDSPLCVCSRDFAHPQFLKLHLLELDFDKVLYLDCDVVVRRNLDGLFAMDTPAAMERIMPMPRHGEKLPNRVCYDGRRVRGIQGGVMLLAPDKNLFATMRAEVEGWRGDEHCRSFRASIGNEQDYLTWRYCEGLAEEDGHPRIWTHLGCEYNCEVHKESMYFAIGRERWLWLDYVRDAAVLHFSAPLRKRAKCLLQHHLGDQGSGTTEESDEDPRVEFAHGIWDEAVEHLRAEVALRGFDLSAWLGSGAGAHAAAFEVVERGEGEGMEISQLSTASASNARGLVFEAFTSNCAAGLVYCPPGFTPGPPWGVSFWTHRASSAPDVDLDPVAAAALAQKLDRACLLDDAASKPVKQRVDSTGGTASPVCDAALQRDGCSGSCGIAGGGSDGAGGSGGEDALNEALSVDAIRAAVVADVEEEHFVCSCRVRRRSPPPPSDPGAELESIGAWLRRPYGGGRELWAFGRVSDPPHLPDCPLWELTASFSAKVLRCAEPTRDNASEGAVA